MSRLPHSFSPPLKWPEFHEARARMLDNLYLALGPRCIIVLQRKDEDEA